MKPQRRSKSLKIFALPKKERSKPRIILDTNVIICAENDDNGRVIAEFLSKYEDHELHVSYVTRLEYLRGRVTNHQIETCLRRINGYNPIEVNEGTFILASCYMYLLGRYVSDSRGQQSILSSIEVPDMLIAAVALHLKAKVLTNNRNDFPSPFFNELAICDLPKSKRLYLLQSDTVYYDKMYSSHKDYLSSIVGLHE